MGFIYAVGLQIYTIICFRVRYLACFTISTTMLVDLITGQIFPLIICTYYAGQSIRIAFCVFHINLELRQSNGRSC